MTLQSQEEHRAKERRNEFLRCGAKRLLSTCVEKDDKHNRLSVREGGHLASASHSVGIYFHAPVRTVFALFVFLMLFGVPSYAQTAPTPTAPAITRPVITGPPRVLVLVYQQPGGADQVSITYDPKVLPAQAAADIDALTQATGWPISSRSITEAPSPLTNRPGAMTSVTFAAPGIVQDSSHTFPVEALARAFHQYKRLNAVFIVGPQFQFQGVRSYADNDIKVVLDQHETSYVYQIEVLNQNFGHLPLAQAQSSVQAGTGARPFGGIPYVFAAALLAGLFVYLITLHMVSRAQPKRDNTDAEAETRLEAGTRK